MIKNLSITSVRTAKDFAELAADGYNDHQQPPDYSYVTIRIPVEDVNLYYPGQKLVLTIKPEEAL